MTDPGVRNSSSEAAWLAPVVALIVLAGVLRAYCDKFLHLTPTTSAALRLPLHAAVVLIPCGVAARIIYRRRLAQNPATSPGLALMGSIFIVTVMAITAFLLLGLVAMFFVY